MNKYVNITPLIRLPRSVEQIFTYHSEVPVKQGQIVLINFHGRRALGAVRSLLDAKPSFKTSPIVRTLPYFLTEHQTQLAKLLTTNYAATESLAFSTIVPNLQRTGAQNKIENAKQLKRTDKQSAKSITIWGNIPDPSSKLMKDIVKKHSEEGQVLILVPDHISLYEAQQYYPDAVLWNTSNSSSATTCWQKVTAGQNIVIGTRNALFAPYQNLKCVVIFDAASELYRSRDAQPKYSAVALVKQLAQTNKLNVVNVQAVPTLLESSGTYLAKHTAKHADLSLVNRRSYSSTDKYETLSSNILDDIKATNGRVIVYANKKGYAALHCSECEYLHRCANCDLPLVSESPTAREAICHRCQTKSQFPSSCPNCHQMTLKHVGHGIRRIYEFLQVSVPDKPVVEIDAQTTKSYASFMQLLETAPDNAILLCTAAILPRMWVIPDVELTILPRADQHLIHYSWKANEEFLNLIYLFLAKSQNKVTLELSQTDYSVVQALKNSDLSPFWKKEKDERKSQGYPPYLNVIVITSKSNLDQFNDLIPNDSLVLATNSKTIFKLKESDNEQLWRELPDDAKVDVNPHSIV